MLIKVNDPNHKRLFFSHSVPEVSVNVISNHFILVTVTTNRLTSHPVVSWLTYVVTYFDMSLRIISSLVFIDP